MEGLICISPEGSLNVVMLGRIIFETPRQRNLAAICHDHRESVNLAPYCVPQSANGRALDIHFTLKHFLSFVDMESLLDEIVVEVNDGVANY